MGQILSQSEIDAILSGLDLSASPLTPPVPAEVIQPADLPLYDFEHPEPLNRSHLDGVRLAAASASRHLETTFTRLFRTPVATSLLGIEQSTFHDYLATADSPCCIAAFESSSPLDASLLEIGRPLAFAMIDCLLGGDPATAASIVDRPFTELETRLLHKVITALLPEFVRELDLAESLAVSALISDSTAVSRSQSHEAVALISFETTLGATHGLLQLCIPWKNAVPQTEISRSRPASAQSMKSGAAKMPVIATASLAKLKMTAKELGELRPGDILVTEVDSDGELRLEVDGREIFHGRPGQCQNRKVIRLTAPIHREAANS